ncbi:Alpha/Beta hydrolase protein [Xylogone sp. PMI_703]|nr:Alpha/Beta hydrolase protein [Xylogone sp. PMI_703]
MTFISPTVNHSHLKTVFHGVSHLTSILPVPIVQYRGIQYATIPYRFRRAILRSNYPANYDAKGHGPPSPQLPIPQIEDILSGLVGQPDHVNVASGLPPNSEWAPADEFKCLNLSITCPADIKQDANLPVMIYIHGGGCMFGSNATWLHDGGNLVARSVQLNKPIIIVSLNYRLNALGWMASDELKADNENSGDLGVGNYGSHDTYLGIEWVYHFIRPFGGDPQNITLIGESAGAFQVASHIHSALPGRFCRAILQSGTLDAPLQSHIASIGDQNNRWEKLKALTKANSVEKLRSVPATDLIKAWFSIHARRHTAAVPEWTLDGAWLRDDWEETVSSRNLQVIIGDTEAEGALYAVLCEISKIKFSDKPINMNTIWNEIETSIPTKAVAILKSYGAESSDCSREQLASATFQILNDLSFRRASEVEAQRLMKKGVSVYRYVFDQGSPFQSGAFTGQAAHSLDLIYAFGNARIFSGEIGVEHPEWECKIQRSMQEKWIAFANGEEPWKAQSEHYYYAFGPQGFDGEIEKQEFQERRKTKRWEAFEALNREELIKFGIACNKAFTELSGYVY